MNYSNSTNDILSTYAQTTQHLSLQNGSISTSDKVTTRSLYDIPKSCIEEEETSEVRDFIFIIKHWEFFLL